MEIKISDITLREEGKTYTLSFKEKIEIAKTLDKLNLSVIETAPITKGKTDVLFLHTIAPLLKNSVLSCPVSLTEESVKETYEAISGAKKKRLHVMVPVSTVQMEYLSHKKPKAMLETLEAVVKKAKECTEDIEVSLMDATRAETAFLYDAVRCAISAGATTLTICDSAGEMLPNEFEKFLNNIYENVPEMKGIQVSVECSDALHMASACTVSCIQNGVCQVKAAVIPVGGTDLCAIAHILRDKGDSLGVSTAVNMASLDNSAIKIKRMTNHSTSSVFDNGTSVSVNEEMTLSENDNLNTVSVAVAKLGYELPDEDLAKVYEEFSKVSKNRTLNAKELEMIVASVAMQVTPTYKLKSYVINSSNLIAPTAQIELEKDGEVLQGIQIGDGPIDAAFLAIEQITGCHYELDDFQIQSVTEGREAMGSSMVKLRSNGKPYAGKGISTDIIGASIKAYINALNKICFEEDHR